MPFYMATGMINQPVNVDDLFYKPGDSISFTAGRAAWAAICDATNRVRWTVPLCKSIRTDVSTIVVTGGISVRISGNSRKNYDNLTAADITVYQNECGLECVYEDTADIVSSIQEVINVSPRGATSKATFS